MNQLMENNIEITFDEVTEVTQKEIGFFYFKRSLTFK